MNALNKPYFASINYPVKYVDIPSGKVIVGDTPDYLTLRISAHGYSIIRHKLSSRYTPISFSVSSFSLSSLSGADTSTYYIQTRFSREHLSSQLSSDFSISDIRPDTLFFRFASIVTKTLPVQPDVVFEYDRQMIIREHPYSIPDSVIVSGPDYIIDTVKAIYTQRKNLGTLSQSFEGNIALNKPENLIIKQEKVKVFVGVERITEKVLLVPLELNNLPDTISIKTFPSSIEVYCQVGLSNFPELKPEAFRVVADFSEATNGTGKLSVNLIKFPDFVRAVKFSPRTVEFLIEK